MCEGVLPLVGDCGKGKRPAARWRPSPLPILLRHDAGLMLLVSEMDGAAERGGGADRTHPQAPSAISWSWGGCRAARAAPDADSPRLASGKAGWG